MKRFSLAILMSVAFFVPGILWAASHAGTITMEFDLANHEIGKRVQLWIPYPVSDNYQKISNISMTGDYATAAVYTDQKFQTPMLYARWDKNAFSRKIIFSFDVERQERVGRNFPAWETNWDTRDYAADLKGTSLGPVTGEVKDLADEITAGKGTVRSKARAIYDWVCVNMFASPQASGSGRGDVCRLLVKRGGNGVDLQSVFVALARASGIPAREVIGIRQGESGTTDITLSQHCWAEYYLPGYGWMAVDPGEVRELMLKQNLTLEDARTVEYRKYYWGGTDPYRVKLGGGRDLILNPRQHGESVNYLMYPFAQIGNKTLDWLSPATFKYKITHVSR